MRNKILTYCFIAFLSIAFYHSFAPVNTEYINETKYIHDTVFVDQVKVEIDTILVSIPNRVDTAAIIKDYYTKKTVKSSYEDEHVSIRIQDDLFKNTIVNRKLDYTLLPRADPTKWFIGSQMYMGQQGGGIALSLSVLKNRNQFSIGYDPITGRTFVGYNYQIRIRSPGKKNGLIHRLLKRKRSK